MWSQWWQFHYTLWFSHFGDKQWRIWVRSRNFGCLVTWFCYQLIAKPGNKTAAVPWPDPYILSNLIFTPSNKTWYYIQHSSDIRWKLTIVMMPTFSSKATQQFVIMTTSCATSDDKVSASWLLILIVYLKESLYLDGLVQERHNSSALAMELCLSCA